VPLSEHEQRLLEQIEQALYAEDPKFASIYQGNDVRTHYRRRVIRATFGLVIGLGMLLAGVVINLIPLGVAGFVVMLAAASFGVASWQRMTGHRVAASRERKVPARSGGPRPPKRSVVQRLEDRWQRRQDER
jgi:Flp pilus assembly protein TadB